MGFVKRLLGLDSGFDVDHVTFTARKEWQVYRNGETWENPILIEHTPTGKRYKTTDNGELVKLDNE